MFQLFLKTRRACAARIVAAAVVLSAYAIWALHPPFSHLKLEPLDSISTSAGVFSKLPSAVPLRQRLRVTVPAKAGARIAQYKLDFSAKIYPSTGPVELVRAFSGPYSLAAIALPSGALSLVRGSPQGEQELLLVPDAFARGQWFNGTLQTTCGGNASLSAEGHVLQIAPAGFDSLSLDAFAFGRKDSAVEGFKLSYDSMGYTPGLAGKSAFERGLSMFAEVALWVFLFSALAALAALALLRLGGIASLATSGELASAAGFVLIAGFVAAVIYNYVQGAYLGHGYPLNTFLFSPENFMMDYFNPLKASAGLNPYLDRTSVEPALYFPLVYLLMSVPAGMPHLLCSACYCAALPVFAWINLRLLRRAGLCGPALWTNVLAFSLLSYPLLFCLDRGNIEIYVALAMAASLFALQDDRSMLAAALLGVAAAAKGYPAVLLPIFLARGRWREALFSLVLVGVLIFVPLALFHGGMFNNLAAWRLGMGFFFSRYALDTYAYAHNCSLFNLLRIIGIRLYGGQDLRSMLSCFGLIGKALGFLLALYVWRIEKNIWKQAAIMICAAMLFVPVSNDYKMLGLFAPLWLLLADGRRSPSDGVYALMLALLLIPKEYNIPGHNMAISVILTPFLMGVLCVLPILEHYVSDPADGRG
jgi:hypothetical protein